MLGFLRRAVRGGRSPSSQDSPGQRLCGASRVSSPEVNGRPKLGAGQGTGSDHLLVFNPEN